MKRPAALAVTAALVLSAAPSVHAAKGYEAHSTVVRYGDLDLNQPAGVRKLYERIRRAARMVCSGRDASSMDSLSALNAERAEYRSCVEEAIDSAVRGTGQPNVTVYANLRARSRSQ